MYLFTTSFRFEHGRAKYEKDIQQDISSNNINLGVLGKFYAESLP